MLRCSDRAQPPWIERPQISTSIFKKKKLKKTWKMTEKNDFFFLKLLLGKMPNPCPFACCKWNNVPNRIYSWSPSQGASEKNILKN